MKKQIATFLSALCLIQCVISPAFATARMPTGLKQVMSMQNSSATFRDVPADSWYAEPVAWAVTQGITTGTSSTTFSPDDTCTNAQVLTFIWRACGEPEPMIDNPFTDVTEDDYYYEAALWAYANDMVTGSVFHADKSCTRSMAVTYLWRTDGSQDIMPNSKFTDVSAGTSYAQAVAWAVEIGITDGTSDSTFSPEVTCTRAHIITFLYRDFAKGNEINSDYEMGTEWNVLPETNSDISTIPASDSNSSTDYIEIVT